MSPTAQDKENDVNKKYQWISAETIPKWTNTCNEKPDSGSPPTPTRLITATERPSRAETPLTPAWQRNASYLSHLPDDWEKLSDASGAEENGTPDARAKQEAAIRREREEVFGIDQKARKKEQLEINERVAKDEKAKEARKYARKEWYESGGVVSAKKDEEQVKGWLGVVKGLLRKR